MKHKKSLLLYPDQMIFTVTESSIQQGIRGMKLNTISS